MTPTMRRRKRPRFTSVDFHRVWWLLRREAAFNILVGSWYGTTVPSLRAALRDATSAEVTADVNKHLAKYPHRRFTT